MFGIGLVLIAAGVLVIVYAMQGKPVFNLTVSEPGPVEPGGKGEPRVKMSDGG